MLASHVKLTPLIGNTASGNEAILQCGKGIYCCDGNRLAVGCCDTGRVLFNSLYKTET